jgi:hypothetical protein
MSSASSVSAYAATATMLECRFDDGPGAVEVIAAPLKRLARMREKLVEYAPLGPGAAGPGAGWPLSANILDPVRASIVCSGPAHMLQVGGRSASSFVVVCLCRHSGSSESVSSS